MRVQRSLMEVRTKLEDEITDSVNWIKDHFPDSYVDSRKCEKCRLGGLCFALAVVKGTTQEEEYQRAVSRIKQPKKKTVKRPVKKRVVVRRKK